MKYLSWPRRHKWLAFFAAILFVILGIFIYYKVSLELNRRAFQQASYAIESIYADIVKEIGLPDDSRNSQGCGGFQGVYGEGPISCDIRVIFIYPVKDLTSANQLQEKIKRVINDQKNLFMPIQAPQVDSSTSGIVVSDSAPSRYYYETASGIECSVVYIFDPSSESRLSLKDKENNKVFYINMNCSGPARAKYF